MGAGVNLIRDNPCYPWLVVFSSVALQIPIVSLKFLQCSTYFPHIRRLISWHFRGWGLAAVEALGDVEQLQDFSLQRREFGRQGLGFFG